MDETQLTFAPISTKIRTSVINNGYLNTKKQHYDITNKKMQKQYVPFGQEKPGHIN